MEAYIKKFDHELYFLNSYGPYKNKELFWKNLEASRLLGIPNLTLAGHLNFTLFSSKFLGHSTHLDPLDIVF